MKGAEWIRRRETLSLILFIILTAGLMYLASLSYESRVDLETKRRIAENSRVALCELLNFVISVKGKVLAVAMIATGLLTWLLAHREEPKLGRKESLIWKTLSVVVVLGTVFLFFVLPYQPVFTGAEYTPGMDCEVLGGP
jgi:multisubunit Na+/H+ antiporter MnhB subunit